MLHIDFPVQPVHHCEALKRICQINFINGVRVNKILLKPTLTSHYSVVLGSHCHSCDTMSCNMRDAYMMCLLRCALYLYGHHVLPTLISGASLKQFFCQTQPLLHVMVQHLTETRSYSASHRDFDMTILMTCVACDRVMTLLL